MNPLNIKNKHASIMVVDDISANLELLSNMLKYYGHRVRPALNGRQALQAAKSDPPDLILLDINMPEMEGFEVCRILKEDKNLKEIPVIFISGLSDKNEKLKAFSSGGVDYITKPFQIEEVYARVETHLKLHQLQREMNEYNT